MTSQNNKFVFPVNPIIGDEMARMRGSREESKAEGLAKGEKKKALEAAKNLLQDGMPHGNKDIGSLSRRILKYVGIN